MIIMAGKPGAGKGTQAELLEKRRGYHSISVGAALREAAKTDPVIAAIQASGKLVDTATAGRVVEEAIERAGTTKLILDGFPRNHEQADWLRNYLARWHDKVVLIIIDVTDNEVMERLAKRGREDDSAEIIQARLKLFHDETLPQLQKLGLDMVTITVDGHGSPNEVYARVDAALARAGI